MRTRTFWMLVLAAAIAAGAGWYAVRQRAGAGRPDPRAGAPLVAFDVNDVAAIRVRAGGNAVDAVRKDGRWVLASLHDYPADYGRLAQRLIELTELKIGQVVPGGTDDLAEFGLDEAGAAALVDFEAADGRKLGQLTLGKTREGRGGGPFGGFPDGQYARAGEGAVVLLGRAPEGWSGEAREWISTELPAVTAGAGSSLEVTVGGETYRLALGPDNRIELEGLGAGEKLDENSARRAVNGLQYLSFQTIADPARTDAELGFETPDRYELRTEKGLRYTVRLGGPAEGGGRYARIAVAYDPPPPAAPVTPPAVDPAAGESAAETAAPKDAAENVAKQAAEENDRLARWTYVLSAWSAESLALPRAKLLVAPQAQTPDAGTPPAEAP